MFGFNNERLFPGKYTVRFSFGPKSVRLMILSECPLRIP